jgi:hypothetical protein
MMPALTREETMSLVIEHWLIELETAIPGKLHDSEEWRSLLPLAAGTGRAAEVEVEREALIFEWLSSTILPRLQPVADEGGYGDAWAAMCRERTATAARAASAAAAETAARSENQQSWTWAAWAAASAVAADAMAAGRASAAAAAAAAVVAGQWAGREGQAGAYWQAVDPVGLLRRLIEAGVG